MFEDTSRLDQMRLDAIDELVARLQNDYGCAVAFILPENITEGESIHDVEDKMYEGVLNAGMISLGD